MMHPSEMEPWELKEIVQEYIVDLRRAYVYLDEGRPFFSGRDCSEMAILFEYFLSISKLEESSDER